VNAFEAGEITVAILEKISKDRCLLMVKGMKILGTLIESTFQEKEAQMLRDLNLTNPNITDTLCGCFTDGS
jgi:hypothetical protein